MTTQRQTIRKANEFGREARTAAEQRRRRYATDVPPPWKTSRFPATTSPRSPRRSTRSLSRPIFWPELPAVEAARAGEAGRGRPNVVAASSSRPTLRPGGQGKFSKIANAIGKTSQGVEISARSRPSPEGNCNAASAELDDLVAEVATASQEQNQGIGQVNTAVAQLERTSAASAEELASSAQELSANRHSSLRAQCETCWHWWMDQTQSSTHTRLYSVNSPDQNRPHWSPESRLATSHSHSLEHTRLTAVAESHP